jgi:hypothetical protein
MPSSTLRQRQSRASSLSRQLWAGLLAAALLGGVIIGGVAVALDKFGRTPREWAPYLERRALNHNPLITGSVDLAAAWLRYADRLPWEGARPTGWAGAAVGRPSLVGERVPPRRPRLIGTVPELRKTLQNAQPGDVIEMLPGTYRLEYPTVGVTANGTAVAPITLRAARLGDVVFQSNGVEAFKVSGPYWIFENLVLEGICEDHSGCEHAFHIAGGADHIILRNNLLMDFNAHIKVNPEGKAPDYGLLEYNTITETRPRNTGNPVTPIDMVAASGWRIAANLITDFVKSGGDNVSYGAFAKGAGDHNVFERNVVLCEYKLRGHGGERIGLSFGGGSTGPQFLRDAGASGSEQISSIMRDNLIAFCSDDGIYLNRAAETVLEHNTLIDTAGIDSRFPESSAEVINNIVDGLIRQRDGGARHAAGNEGSPLLGLFVGWHPARHLFVNPARLDLHWRSPPTLRPTTPGSTDLCGITRGTEARPGAFDDFTPCLRGDTRQ